MDAKLLDLLEQIAKAIAAQFGSNCEVVIHELSGKSAYSSIVAIENGHVTGRKVGDGPSHVVLEQLGHEDDSAKDQLAYLTRTKDGKILMVRQYRNALDRFTLEIPAGKLDAPDEPKIECAARELEEETGFRSENLEFLMTVNTTVAFCDERIGVYIAKDLIPSKQHLDADESIDVEEWEVKDLLDLIYSGKMTDAKTIAAILAYAQKEGIR